jgi:protein involved in polysaccharide export with SLBB domain
MNSFGGSSRLLKIFMADTSITRGGMMRARVAFFGWVLSASAAITPIAATHAAAQTPPVQDTAAARRAASQRLGREISQQEVLDRVKASGLNRAQMRAYLQRAGYDPGLADRYFDAMERGDSIRGTPGADFLQALSALEPRRLTGDSLNAASAAAITLREKNLTDTLPHGIEVFGLRTFRRGGTQFDALAAGPVDPGYRIGPGDEIVLVLTGDVEEAYRSPVTRDGQLFVPDVGQISVLGLTLGELTDVLYTRLGRVYSGVTRAPDAPIRFHVSLGNLRANQVFVRGEVAAPGAYQISSIGSLFTALYAAGGPTAQGSFRKVQVQRGGRVVATVDLYDFLIGGSTGPDIRLENNDQVFGPPAETQVTADGAVRRPAIYEKKSGEGVRTLLRFTGGLSATAQIRHIQIDRILPPAQQRPGTYRTLKDVDLVRIFGGGPDEPLVDGDQVHFFAVPEEVRNRIAIVGAVRNPGLYEWFSGQTLWSALEHADGVDETAYLARAQVFRFVPADRTRTMIPVSLERDSTGRPVQNITLEDRDSVVVLSRADLRVEEQVFIDGYVKRPLAMPLARGMTLRDIILAAGGFQEGAYPLYAEVARRLSPLVRSDTTALVYRIDLANSNPPNTMANPTTLVPEWEPRASDFVLQGGDHVAVRRAPGYEDARSVFVGGEVMTPGIYVLSTRGERLDNVVRRAGGLTSQAFADGLHVIREGRLIAGDMGRAITTPGDRNNIVMLAGDSVIVPIYNPMVVITGAVAFETNAVFRQGKGLDYYISQAGGYGDSADRSRVLIIYPSGARAAVKRHLFYTTTPPVTPGAQIYVPAKAEKRGGPDWGQIVTRATAVLTTVATVVLAIRQLK